MYNSLDIIRELEEKGLNVFRAQANHVDIYFESNDYEYFLELIDKLGVTIVFIDATKFTKDEIEYNHIDKTDIQREYMWEIIKQDVVEFNAKNKKMKEYIGYDQDIRIFFTHHGMVYSVMLFNEEFYIENKDDFIEGLTEKYEEEIEEVRRNYFGEKKNQIKEKLSQLRDYLIHDESFKKCTNITLRSGYIYDLVHEKDVINFDGVPASMIRDTVEEAWRKVKLDAALNKKK